MNPIKFVLILLFISLTSKAYSQYTDVINSNRPGASRSAYSVGTNVLQFEAGPYFVQEKRTPATAYKISGFGVDFATRYGLIWEELELNFEGTYQNDTKTFTGVSGIEESRSNFKFLTIGAKYLVFDPYKNKEEDKPNLYSWKANNRFKWSSLIPAVSVYLGVNYDTKQNPYTAPLIEGFSPKLMIATQNNFAGGWVMVINLIKDRIGTDQSDFEYIFTLTHSISPKWVIFGEAQGIKSDFYADNLFRFGGAYLAGKNLQLDTAVTFNTKDTPSVLNLNLGVSYRLDFHKDKTDTNENSEQILSRKQSRKNKKNKEKEPLHIKQKRKDTDFNNFN